MPKGVYIRTGWHRIINARGHTGLKQSSVTALRRSSALRGRVRSALELERASKSLKKHYQNHPEELIGANNPFYGRKHSLETRIHLSERHKVLWQDKEIRGKLISSILKGRRVSFPFDSRLESDLSQALTQANLSFQYQISLDSPSSPNYDFGVFIGGVIVYVEIAGCYWHGCPRCFGDVKEKLQNSEGSSERKTKSLRTQVKGYYKLKEKEYAHSKVVILWEHDIKKKGYDWCIQQIRQKAGLLT